MGKLVRAVKARLETSALKELPHGIYFSKALPSSFEKDEEDYDDENPKYKARLSSYNVNGGARVFFFADLPKKLANVRNVEDVIVAVASRPELKGAKIMRNKGDGETAFLFKVASGYVTIAFDND